MFQCATLFAILVCGGRGDFLLPLGLDHRWALGFVWLSFGLNWLNLGVVLGWPVFRFWGLFQQCLLLLQGGWYLICFFGLWIGATQAA